jgi:hypothetical protein
LFFFLYFRWASSNFWWIFTNWGNRNRRHPKSIADTTSSNCFPVAVGPWNEIATSRRHPKILEATQCWQNWFAVFQARLMLEADFVLWLGVQTICLTRPCTTGFARPLISDHLWDWVYLQNIHTNPWISIYTLNFQFKITRVDDKTNAVYS